MSYDFSKDISVCEGGKEDFISNAIYLYKAFSNNSFKADLKKRETEMAVLMKRMCCFCSSRLSPYRLMQLVLCDNETEAVIVI